MKKSDNVNLLDIMHNGKAGRLDRYSLAESAATM